MQPPPLHDVMEQRRPHMPQCMLFVFVFTQPPEQQVGVPPPQAFPQLPQFIALLCGSTQVPPQQRRPAAHVRPQLPQ